MSERRILILGEGFSHDPHYGKTLRGIVRYGPDPVVAILDSRRAGAEHEGIPIVGTVEDALAFRPSRSSGSRPRAAGSRRPGGRSSGSASSAGSTSRAACTSSSRTIGSWLRSRPRAA
jgi:hypothetical protein